MKSVEALALILLLLALLPFVVYLSVKLGTYAFLRGREIFEQERLKKKGEPNGPKGS